MVHPRRGTFGECIDLEVQRSKAALPSGFQEVGEGDDLQSIIVSATWNGETDVVLCLDPAPQCTEYVMQAIHSWLSILQNYHAYAGSSVVEFTVLCPM